MIGRSNSGDTEVKSGDTFTIPPLKEAQFELLLSK
jgi:hypothetical protein